MSAFTKPQPVKAALKIGVYGPAGSGKTFSSLLIAEGLARVSGKRIAFIDTEYGTAFYGQTVPQRRVHPEKFDFDVLHTKSITEVLDAVRSLNPAEHSVLVIDSISHLWEACKSAFQGRTTRNGAIPFQAWSVIKKPYRSLMHEVLSSPLHAILCGRQGVDYGEDEATGELKALGYRMKAEGETPYEPDVLIRMEARRTAKKSIAVTTAHVEKDRTGVLAGRSIAWPTFANIAEPLLGLLGGTHVAPPTDDEVGMQDADALARAETDEMQRSTELASEFTERMGLAESVSDLQRIGEELTPVVKARLAGDDVGRIRKAYAARLAALRVGVNKTTVAHID